MYTNSTTLSFSKINIYKLILVSSAQDIRALLTFPRPNFLNYKSDNSITM